MALPLEVLASDLASALAENDLLRFELEKRDREKASLEMDLKHATEMCAHLKWVVKKQRQKLVSKGDLARGGREVA